MQQRILPIHSLASGKEKQLSKPRTPKLSLLIQEVYSSTVWYTSSESTVSLTAFGSLRSWGCWNMRGLRFWRTRLRGLLEEERRPLPKSIDKGGIDVADFWEPCPRCGSKHVQTWSYWRSIMLMIPLAFGGCLFLLAGALFWPLWVVAGVLLLMAPLSFLPLFVKLKICKTCKLMWNPKKMKQASRERCLFSLGLIGLKEWAKSFYKSKAWRQCRDAYFVLQHDLCERCNRPGNPFTWYIPGQILQLIFLHVPL